MQQDDQHDPQRTKIEIRMTQDQKNVMQAAANKDHLTVSAWARRVLIMAAMQEGKE